MLCSLCNKDIMFFNIDLRTGFCPSCRKKSKKLSNEELSKLKQQHSQKNKSSKDELSRTGSIRDLFTDVVTINIAGFCFFLSGIIQLLITYITSNFSFVSISMDAVLWWSRIAIGLFTLGGLLLGVTKSKD